MWLWTHDWLKLRREHSALRGGRLIDLFYDDDAYAYARQDSKETVIVVLNRSAVERSITLRADVIDARDGSGLLPLSGAKSGAKVTKGQIVLAIAPQTAVAYQLSSR